MPRITVAIPAYNHENYIAQTIQSVLDQTFQDFEIVITDDGSTDGTVNIIRTFTDPRIRLFCFERNQGASIAMNNCIREARGEYIAVLNSDDLFLPDKLEKQIAFLDNNPGIGAVFGYARIIDEEGNDFTDTSHFYHDIFKQPNRSRFEWLNYFFYKGNALCHPSVLIHKDCYEKVGYYDERLAQLPDLDLWMRLCLKYEIYIIPENLIKFRVRAGEANVSGNRPGGRIRYMAEHSYLLKNYFNINTYKEIYCVFPEAIKYKDCFDERLIPFYLSMFALENGFAIHHNFAIFTLFDLLNDPETRKRLLDKHGFSMLKFIDLSGKYDLFNADLKNLLQQKDEQIQQKDQQVRQLQATVEAHQQELNRMRESLGWKILIQIVKFRDRMCPVHTRRRRIYDLSLKGVRRMLRSRLVIPLRPYLPKISIVASVYNKEKEVVIFLQSLLRQDYKGPYEIILIDDASTDATVAAIERFGKRHTMPNLILVPFSTNRGQCAARNCGIKQATGDIIVVIDSDCVVNKQFLRVHAETHRDPDYHVVVGPFNLETGGGDPHTVLGRYCKKNAVLADMKLQDPRNRQSFLNCITRNFSIKRQYLDDPLFDEEFSYRADNQSGFGWEDVEMGFRLYKKGLRIAFAEDAISVHQTHPSTTPDHLKPVRSLRNFRRLFDKHPELRWVASDWTVQTYYRILDWLKRQDNQVENEDRVRLDHVLSDVLNEPPAPAPGRRRRVLSYRWHCGHQYELHKLPHQFTLARGLTAFASNWDYRSRPLRPNVAFKDLRKIKPHDFDLAILHFDENVLNVENGNGVLPKDWGDMFVWFRNHLQIPMIAICHGTPQFFGQYNSEYSGPNQLQAIEQERRRMVDFLGDIVVVCNSYQAQKEWGFRKSTVIWHGFDPSEYPLATYNKAVITVANSMRHRPHYRGFALYQAVTQGLPCVELGGEEPNSISVPEPVGYVQGTNDYAFAKFRNYVDTVREYSIFFNPTQRSPMPRSRAEAMLCGLAIVTANNHDVDQFIRNGENGFYSNDPAELREHLTFLLKHPDVAKKIGLEGRRTAMREFSINRYLCQWQRLIDEVMGD